MPDHVIGRRSNCRPINGHWFGQRKLRQKYLAKGIKIIIKAFEALISGLDGGVHVGTMALCKTQRQGMFCGYLGVAIALSVLFELDPKRTSFVRVRDGLNH
jgi:hypothetical protein